MNNSPLVSIILTSYNHKEFLGHALDSIISQTYSNVEIIVVDDCSTDGSQQLLKEYKNIFPHINLYLLEKNTGSYVNSSNYGAGLAKGDYINFAQCDDFSEPGQIEELVKIANEFSDVGVIYSRSFLVNHTGHIISDDYQNREIKFKKKCKKDAFLKGPLMLEFLSFSCVLPNLSAAIIKRELFNSTGGLSTKYKVAADWAFWIELSFKTDFFYVSKPLNYFRQHSTTIRNTIKFENQVLELFEIFYSVLSLKKLSFFQKKRLLIGANIVWISGLIMNKKMFANTFYSINKRVKKYNKFNFFYFISCLVKVIIETLLKRLVNLRLKSG